MLLYDQKQIMHLYRWFLPAALFTLIVIIPRSDILIDRLSGREPVPYGWTIGFVLESLKSEAALFAAPILSVLPYGTACMDELKCGMYRHIIGRTGKDRYIRSKGIACLASGGLTMSTAVLLFFCLAWALTGLREVPSDGYANCYEQIRCFLGLMARYGCFGGLCSLCGMLMALLTMNRMMACTGAFILDYLLVIFYERYPTGLMIFYPKEWICMTWTWPFLDAGICLWMCLLAGFLYMLVMICGMRVIKDA